MCEALDGTFRRDYVFESCLDDLKTVLRQIQGRVDDYNNFAHHSARKMKTPKEYFIFKIAA
jgi:putative transposase